MFSAGPRASPAAVAGAPVSSGCDLLREGKKGAEARPEDYESEGMNL